ncbi:hypothetical protein CYMTET_3191 [Cymbomonas tetramitiformis]|uniref:Histone deacetylase complex subunit SAP30 Sin3 binding domain-containing protein n=1 Tax=Cymbomonas tetramitiformis TaxID=36881 RepID=A0AAE0H3T3_9CHLO|nr:hypothetical protein CYMTET_3191 [Cymbomonas tetramitiformis]|eukprot:gene12496-14762_t
MSVVDESRSHLPTNEPDNSDEEGSDEEELPLLPRHTKVLVTGNNRTKTALVGLHGIVKKAVGLGGWHWLVLSTGEEIRLQRNALSVLEPPPPEDMEDEEEDRNQGSDDTAIAQEQQCDKTRRKRIKPSAVAESSMNVGGIGKSVAMRRSSDRKRDVVCGSINLAKLDTGSLRRYRRFYKLELGPNSSKEQLVSAVTQHFNAQSVEETNVLAGLVVALQSGSIAGRRA